MAQDLSKMVDDISTWATARIAAYAEASKTTMTKLSGNAPYTGDDLTADLTAAWSRLAEDVTSFMKLLPTLGDPGPGPGGPA